MKLKVRAGLAVTLLLSTVACTSKSTSAPGTSSIGPAGLRIVYEVSDHTSSPVVISTVVSESASPFLGKTLTYSGSSTSAPLVSGLAWTADALYNINADGGVQQTQLIPPGAAPPATHLDVALPLALSQGIVTKLGSGTVLGRPCTMWRSQEPLDSAPFAKADAANYTTSCVTAGGILLSDSWTINGKLAQTRTATEVDPIAHYSEAQVLGGVSATPVPPGFADEVVANVALNADDLGVAAVAPAGYMYDRSVSVTRSIAGDSAPVVVRIGEVDSFVDGPNLMVLRRTKDLTGPALPSTAGAPIQLGDLGKGYIDPTGTGVEVTVLTKKGILVTGDSTSSPGALVGWLKSLKLS